MSRDKLKPNGCGLATCEECEKKFYPTVYNCDLCPDCDPPPNLCGICGTTEFGITQLETKKVCPDCDTRDLPPEIQVLVKALEAFIAVDTLAMRNDHKHFDDLVEKARAAILLARGEG